MKVKATVLQASIMLAGKVIMMSDAQEAPAFNETRAVALDGERDGRDGREGPRSEVDEKEESRDSEGGSGGQMGEVSGVYFFVTADDRFVKIGYSAKILTRLAQIRTIGPGTAGARLIGYLPGTIETERWLHRRFAALRDSGEWFRYTDEVRDFASSLLPPPKVKESAVDQAKAKPAKPIMEATKLARTGEKNPYAVALGKLGGRKGGLATARNRTPEQRRLSAKKAGDASGTARMTSLTPAHRIEIARTAAKARWAKKKKLP